MLLNLIGILHKTYLSIKDQCAIIVVYAMLIHIEYLHEKDEVNCIGSFGLGIFEL